MKRFWPLYLALFCWLLVLLVPTTRLGTFGAYDNWGIFANRHDDDEESTEDFNVISASTLALLERYPNDKNIETYAATEAASAESALGYGSTSDFESLAKRYPDDPYVVVLRIRNALVPTRSDYLGRVLPGTKEKSGRTNVPIFVWEKLIALARRGQRLEPQNSYFDCVLIAALLAVRRDDEARSVLKSASRKPNFDLHVRDENQSRIYIFKRLYGAALPPNALLAARQIVTFRELEAFADLAYWTTELVIADRAAGRHDRAFETALYLMNLGRTMRRESDSFTGSKMGFRTEMIATTNLVSAPRQTRLNSAESLVSYQKRPETLYAYAKAQGRGNVAQLVSADWQEKFNWHKAVWYNFSWQRQQAPALVPILVANRLRAFLLNTLPFAVVLCVVFGLTMRRLPLNPVIPTPKAFYGKGAKVGIGLVLLALIATTAVTVSNTLHFEPDNLVENLLISRQQDLLEMAPSWFSFGLPAIFLCVAMYLAGRWQDAQLGPTISLMERIKRLNAPVEDGLANFDMSWAAGLMFRLTYWIMLIGVIALFYIDHFYWGDSFIEMREQVGVLQNMSQLSEGTILMAGLLCSLVVLAISWANRPNKQLALRLAFRNIFQMTAGYLIAASLLYTFVTFAILPLTLRVTRDFETMIQKGESHMRTAELGLK